MKNLVNAAIGAMMLIGISAPAEAQRYYMRERLLTKSEPAAVTYVPVYGSYGACSGGVRSAVIVSCTGSDSNTYPASRCGPATKTMACTPKAVCGLPTVNQWDGPRGSGYVAHSRSGVNSAADAQTHCNEQGAIYGRSGACLWDAQAKIAYYNEAASVISYANNVLYASSCIVE